MAFISINNSSNFVGLFDTEKQYFEQLVEVKVYTFLQYSF